MILLRNFVNIFFISELRKKLLFTLGVLVVYRLGNVIPVIGVDVDRLLAQMTQPTGLGGLFSYLDLFSGGNLRECTLFALGIMPYITASIMMQVLSMSVPTLEQLAKEGEYGRKLINQYTRYLALGICVLHSFGYATVLERMGLVVESGIGFRIMFMLTITVGSMFVMWLGEQISLFGIGNGTSMIIFAGIVARFPADIIRIGGAVQEKIMSPTMALLVIALAIAMMACVVFLEKGERKIPVQYTRRVVGQRVYSGQSSYIPFKINVAGVMPVIFANAFLNIPIFIASVLASRFEFFKWISETLLTPVGLLYNVLLFIFIIFFSFVYTALQFNPEELAENIKKGGGFIPGLRPGRKTAEFLNHVLTRLGLVGAFYLGVLALLPTGIHKLLSLPFYLSIMGGTALLIVVGVTLETAAQIESYLIEHHYEGFLTIGRLRGRR